MGVGRSGRGGCNNACNNNDAIVDGDDYTAGVAVSLWPAKCLCGGVAVSPFVHTTLTALATYKACVWTGRWDGSACSRTSRLSLPYLSLPFDIPCVRPYLRVCGHRAPGISLALPVFGFVVCVSYGGVVHSYHASFRGVGGLLVFVCS